MISTENPGFAEKNLVYQSKTRFFKSQNQVFLWKKKKKKKQAKKKKKTGFST